ncbi:MAG: thiamine phosphate synthase [Armatimonadota bacterium]|nr:thiamine phosphate synthase [Armatimonadota bacterium]
MRLREPLTGIYVITDATLVPGRGHLEVARAAVAGGARVVQLRDKQAPDSHLLPIAREIRRLTLEAGVLFVVNDRLDLARAVGADGVHLGQEDLPAAEARRRWPEGVVGVSVDDERTARQAEADGADYLGVGPIFGTATKGDAGPAVGLEQIARIRAVSRLPIVAIGGIQIANVAQVAAAGAHCAAVISAVVAAADMVAAVRALVEAFAAGRASREAATGS